MLLGHRLAPFALLVVHAAVYGTWIVDDAAITFSYARNFVDGHGFVTWPGAAPVEGFSNLAWLLCLIPFLALGLFDPIWTPKLLGLALTCAALCLLRRTSVRSLAPERPIWLADAALLFVVANPAVVIWCVSGLENPLYLFAVAGIVEHATRPADWRGRDALVATAWALLAATTRPDGLAFAAIWPLTVLLEHRAGEFSRRFALAAKCAAMTVCGFSLVTLWRFVTFGDYVANTAHAKLHPGGLVRVALACLWFAGAIAMVRWLRSRPQPGDDQLRTHIVRALGLVAFVTVFAIPELQTGQRAALRALAAPGLGIVLFALAVERSTWPFKGPSPDAGPGTAVGLFTAAFVVGALPSDWMGEQRFASPMLLLGGSFGALAVAGLARAAIDRRRRWLTTMTTALLLAGLAVTGYRFVRRARDFTSSPTVPMQQVQGDFEATFAAWARDLPESDPTVLIPDVGGALWSNCLPVIDLGGLCDARIARLLSRGDREALADLILTDLRPAFVGMHGHWAWDSGLPDDPRFERDYVSVWTEPDAWLSARADRPLRSGRYVRRDLDPGEATRQAWRRSARTTLGLDRSD